MKVQSKQSNPAQNLSCSLSHICSSDIHKHLHPYTSETAYPPFKFCGKHPKYPHDTPAFRSSLQFSSNNLKQEFPRSNHSILVQVRLADNKNLTFSTIRLVADQYSALANIQGPGNQNQMDTPPGYHGR